MLATDEKKPALSGLSIAKIFLRCDVVQVDNSTYEHNHNYKCNN